MATLNTTNIKHASSSTNNIVLNADGSTTIPNLSVGPNRNKVINGEMKVSQRHDTTVQTGKTSSAYYIDRFHLSIDNIGTWSLSQSTDSPDGFSNSFKIDCTTADASPAGADHMYLSQKIEGQDLQDLQKGTSSAKTVFLSFYVKSTKTGTFIAELVDEDNSQRHINKSYTISNTNWNRYTIEFPGDTTGTLDHDANKSLSLNFWLASGSNYSSGSLQTSWGADTNANRNVGGTNLADSTSNEFYITGVQLEVNSVATDFEHRSYGQELALCQRYYEKITINGNEIYHFGVNQYGSGGRIPIFLRVTKRAIPTVTLDADNWTYYVVTGSGSNGNASFNTNSYSTDAIGMTTTGAGASSTYWAVKSANGYIEANSEL